MTFIFSRGRDRKKKFGEKVKNMRMPSPGEVVRGYLNTDFHKSFKQPLMSRARQEDQETQKERQFIVEHFTPSELAQLSGPWDIPLPKFRSKNRSKSTEKKPAEEG